MNSTPAGFHASEIFFYDTESNSHFTLGEFTPSMRRNPAGVNTPAGNLLWNGPLVVHCSWKCPCKEYFVRGLLSILSIQRWIPLWKSVEIYVDSNAGASKILEIFPNKKPVWVGIEKSIELHLCFVELVFSIDIANVKIVWICDLKSEHFCDYQINKWNQTKFCLPWTSKNETWNFSGL